METNKHKLTRLKQVVYAMENKNWRPRRKYSKQVLRDLLADTNLTIPDDLKIRATILLLE